MAAATTDRTKAEAALAAGHDWDAVRAAIGDWRKCLQKHEPYAVQTLDAIEDVLNGIPDALTAVPASPSRLRGREAFASAGSSPAGCQPDNSQDAEEASGRTGRPAGGAANLPEHSEGVSGARREAEKPTRGETA